MLDIDLPIANRKSFLPDLLAKNTPKIRALLLLRRLLLEMQSNIDNRKEVRRAIYELYQNPEMLKAVREALAVFQNYRLPTGKELPPGAHAAASQLPPGDAGATQGTAKKPA